MSYVLTFVEVSLQVNVRVKLEHHAHDGIISHKRPVTAASRMFPYNI